MYPILYTQEVPVDQTLPIGRIGNPELMDHPKDHSLFGLGLPGYIYIYTYIHLIFYMIPVSLFTFCTMHYSIL